jgi:phosphoribosylformylglycinamidine cyclo-ligase
MSKKMEKKFATYAEAGVSIEANDEMIDKIHHHVSQTYTPRVIQMKDAFAGLFRLDYDEKLFKKNYKNPVLVACTDGVGSKVQLAAEIKKYDTVGIDLVAMNVNDMLVMGAEPLFFLDYLGVNKLEPAIIAQMVKGVCSGCLLADCALIGGETAEMPDTYRKDDFDMAGFAVGVVERNRIINGKNIAKGDVILGLASSGLHSNGYTLARNVCFKQNSFKMTDTFDELDGAKLGDVLLEPTRIYVKSVKKVVSHYKVKSIVHGMAHITGSGLPGNIPRVLPKDCDAVIKKSSWPKPKIFDFIQKYGPVEEEEMYRVFNMGIGFVMIVAADFADSVQQQLEKSGEKVYRIGQIAKGKGEVVLNK